MTIKNKIVLGTMKLKNYFNNSIELSKFLIHAHQKGIRQIHVSSEYDSYKLLLKSLKNIKKKFKFIIKLSESSDVNKEFQLKSFKNKFKKYSKDLGRENIQTIQWVNRYKLNSPEEYFIYKEKILKKIKNIIKYYKKKN